MFRNKSASGGHHGNFGAVVKRAQQVYNLEDEQLNNRRHHKSQNKVGRSTRHVMAQSLKIPKADKISLIEVAKQLDEVQYADDPTVSTAGKTIENTSSVFQRTTRTPMSYSLNFKTAPQSRSSSREAWRARNLKKIDDESHHPKPIVGFSPFLSANTLRAVNLKYSFPKSKRADPSSQDDHKIQDLFYDLPSTNTSRAANFHNKTEYRKPELFLRSLPGNSSPSPQRYNVKRLFEKASSTRPRPECTFGIPFEAYRNVVIGSNQFLGLKRYASP